MTQDKCVYTIRIQSTDTTDVTESVIRQQIQAHIEDSNHNENFSAEVIEEKEIEGEVTFSVEVHGDAYEIPVFEEGLTEVPHIEIEADVAIGESKFSEKQ